MFTPGEILSGNGNESYFWLPAIKTSRRESENEEGRQRR